MMSYMNNTTSILTTHWQLAPINSAVNVLQGVDDIHACIANILNTIKGTDVLRPEFGSDHFKYIDYPEDEAIPNFVREITFALQKWEPRINVENVDVSGSAPHFEFTISWTLTDSVYRDIYQSKVNI